MPFATGPNVRLVDGERRSEAPKRSWVLMVNLNEIRNSWRLSHRAKRRHESGRTTRERTHLPFRHDAAADVTGRHLPLRTPPRPRPPQVLPLAQPRHLDGWRDFGQVALLRFENILLAGARCEAIGKAAFDCQATGSYYTCERAIDLLRFGKNRLDMR